jgi:hypothetical protein
LAFVIYAINKKESMIGRITNSSAAPKILIDTTIKNYISKICTTKSIVRVDWYILSSAIVAILL